MSYTFDRIKQKVEESTELLDAKKVDIGFCYCHTKVGYRTDINFICPKENGFFTKVRRTNVIAQADRFLIGEPREGCMTFVKTMSNSLYITMMSDCTKFITMAYAKAVPTENNKYTLTVFLNIWNFRGVVVSAESKEIEVEVKETLRISDNVFVINTSDDEVFLVKIVEE